MEDSKNGTKPNPRGNAPSFILVSRYILYQEFVLRVNGSVVNPDSFHCLFQVSVLLLYY
jgi:hypothetical protein